ncbi:MAG: hypothetical protein J6A30_06835 [Ruminococcus sp.]|nr:hypothetical protein [Ruminococcus sp.]
MRITERERKQYLKQIKKLLVCKGSKKRKFLKSFDDNIEEFLKDNPDASYDELQKNMGTPQEIANGFLENESAVHIKNQTTIVKWVIIGIIICLIIVAITFVAVFIDAHESNHASGEITITEETVNEYGEIEEVVIEEFTK